MAVRLQRHLGRVETLDLCQYTVRTASGTPAWRCMCGAIDELPRTHTIDEGGRVVPAVKCGNPTCSFLDYLVLESFGEDVLT